MFGYRVPRPDEAMLISGGKAGEAGAPFRVVKGNGAFVVPFFRNASFLTLAMQEAEVQESCVTQQGIEVNVSAVCAFKVAADDESIVNAGQRFLSDQPQMPTLTGRIFAGHLRSIIGSMTVEDIVRQRQTLATNVLDASKDEMAKLGLLVDAFQIQSLDDGGSGYITAMAAPHNAAIQQAAKIAQAAADTASADAVQNSARSQADYARQTAIKQAEYDAEVQAAQAAAAQKGPLARAQAEQEVTAQQTVLATRQAELRTQQLRVEVVAPAEAEASRMVAIAEAGAKATKLTAEATAANDRVSLDQLLLTQLPQLVTAAAAGLQGSHLTVLNGSEGLSEVASGLVNQVLAIYKSAREANGATAADPNG